MGHDLLEINAVISERARMVEKMDIGLEAGLAVRREIESAVFSEGRTRENTSFMKRFSRIRCLNLMRRLKKAQNAIQNLT